MAKKIEKILVKQGGHRFCVKDRKKIKQYLHMAEFNGNLGHPTEVLKTVKE